MDLNNESDHLNNYEMNRKSDESEIEHCNRLNGQQNEPDHQDVNDSFIVTGDELVIYQSDEKSESSESVERLNMHFASNRFIYDEAQVELEDGETSNRWAVDLDELDEDNEINRLNSFSWYRLMGNNELVTLNDLRLVEMDEPAQNSTYSLNDSSESDERIDEKLTGLELVPYVSEERDCVVGSNNLIKNEFDDFCNFKENYLDPTSGQYDGEPFDELLESYKIDFINHFLKIKKRRKPHKLKIRHLIDGDHSIDRLTNVRTDDHLLEESTFSSHTINLNLPIDNFSCLPESFFANECLLDFSSIS